eukprot:352161-Chlamydomonas_euryale.AAC.3
MALENCSKSTLPRPSRSACAIIASRRASEDTSPSRRMKARRSRTLMRPSPSRSNTRNASDSSAVSARLLSWRQGMCGCGVGGVCTEWRGRFCAGQESLRVRDRVRVRVSQSQSESESVRVREK